MVAFAAAEPSLKALASIFARGEDPLLEDYRFYFKGELARKKRQCIEAAEAYEAVVTQKKKKGIPSRWYRPSLKKLAEANSCMGKIEVARGYWERALEESANQEEKSEVLYQLALLSRKEGLG